MTDQLNLLPEERVKELRRNYIARVCNVGLALLSAGTIIGGIFLLPTHAFIKGQYDAAAAELAERGIPREQAVESGAVMPNDGQPAVVQQLERTQPASPLLRDLMNVSRDGIVLTKIEYARAVSGQRTVICTGKARNRDALAGFVERMKGLPTVSQVQLPVSAYAKESDLPFALTLTLQS